MRLLSIVITITILTSCAHNKIRFTRMPEVITIESDQATTHKNNETSEWKSVISEQKHEELATALESEEVINGDQITEPIFEDLPETIQDSTDLTDTERQIIEWQATKAEHNAKRATLNASIFLPIVGLGILFSFLTFSSIPALAGLIIGLVFLILGIVYYAKASGSRYITPRGQKFLTYALIALIIDGVAIAAITLLAFI